MKAAGVRIFVGGLRPARQEEHHQSRLGIAELPTWVVTPLTSANRWNEKAGLRTGCGVRSQVIDVLKAQEIKETGNEEG